MRKLIVLFGILLGLTGMAAAQTTVTATVTDSDGTAWANGSCNAAYLPPTGSVGPLFNTLTGQQISSTPVSCTLNSSGGMSVNLIPTANVLGAGNRPSPGVAFVVCPSFVFGACYSTGPIVITGTSQSVSTQINAVIQAPRISGVSSIAQAYNDTEVKVVSGQGNMYFRLSDGTLRCYLSSAWGGCSSAGGDTITSPNSTLTVGGSSTATTLDLNLANANIWTARQAFTDATQGFYIGAYTGGSGIGALYVYGATPSAGNYVFAASTSNTYVNSSATGHLQITGGDICSWSSAGLGCSGFVSKATKFTISGCSAGTTVGGATAGQFASGTSGTCTVVITMNGATGLTAPNGWACRATDITTPADVINQIAPVSTTACTVSGTTVSGDTIVFSAIGY